MEEIGRRLRETREAKGITLQVAEDETKIRRKYLEALECGREADLPGEAYLKGFLRTYGNYLGLDGPMLVSEYKQRKQAQLEAEQAAREAEHGHGHHHRGSRPTDRPDGTGDIAPLRSRRDQRDHSTRSTEGAPVWVRRVAVLVLAAVILAGVGYFGWQKLRPGGTPSPSDQNAPPAGETQRPQDSTPEQEPGVDVEEEQPKAKVTLKKDPQGNLTFSVPGDEAELRLETGSRLWLAATVDDKEQFSGTTIEALEFRGKKMKIQVGHLNGVTLIINGERFENVMDGGPFWVYINTQ